MVDNKRLEYLESIYQDKCCITQNDKDIQLIIKELKRYRSIGSIENVSRKYNIDFVKKEMERNSKAWNNRERFIMLNKAIMIVEAGM